jgi:hypothetical protein
MSITRTNDAPVPTVRSHPRRGPAGLADTASTMTLTHLSWLAWLWATVAVLFAVAMIIIGNVGELDNSLWRTVVASWQHWVVGWAGLSTTTMFLPMFVGNGVTRARLASSAVVTMIVMSLASATFVLLGYLGEGIAFEVLGWPHVAGSASDAIGGFRPSVELFVDHAITSAGFFTAGWLAGICWHRWSMTALGALPLIVLPIAIVELALRGRPGVDLIDGLDLDPGLVVGIAASLAAIVAGCVVAGRLGKELEVR